MLCSSEFQNLRTTGDGLLDLQAVSNSPADVQSMSVNGTKRPRANSTRALLATHRMHRQMTYNNRIALMRRLLKSDSEEENEGDDHIDGEQESPKISFKAEAADAMDVAESPEDMIPLPQAKMELDQPDPRDVD